MWALLMRRDVPVGRPIHCEKREKPTMEEVTRVQEQYIAELMRYARSFCPPRHSSDVCFFRLQYMGYVQGQLCEEQEEGAEHHRLRGVVRLGDLCVGGKVEAETKCVQGTI
jgi:hypothetical protein